MTVRAALALGTVFIVGALDGASTAGAQGTWCATCSYRKAVNCGFYTWEQCRAALSVGGGICSRNAYLVADDHARPALAPAALVTSCYNMADQVVPRMRGRQAWVVRRADYCIRNGGRL
jgi:hypothetical protein